MVKVQDFRKIIDHCSQGDSNGVRNVLIGLGTRCTKVVKVCENV